MNYSLINYYDPVCYSRTILPNKGIFYGDSPFTFDTPLLLIQLSICAVVTGILQHFLTPLGQSVFISQILAGVILGPTLLGRHETFKHLVFPVTSFYVVDTFAFFGLMLFLFTIGVKTDLSIIRESGKKTVAIGVCGFLTPLLLNFLIGEILMHYIPMEPRLHRSIEWIASFQALSSFHVIASLLADLKLMNSELGRLAISSSMISGICSWVWTVLVFAGKQSVSIKKQSTVPFMVLFMVIMVLFALFIFRPLVLWMIQSASNEKIIKEGHIIAIYILVLGSALFGEIFGQHFIFGPMILGMLVPDGPPLGTALVNKLDSFISKIILPVFFVVSGAKIDFTAISSRNFAIIESLAVFSLLWKVIGVMLPSVYCKMPVTDAFHLGLIMGNQGIMEVLYLERAQSVNLIDGQSYSIMVLSVALFTGILAPVVKFSYNPSKKYTAGERRTMLNADPLAELRILACVHYQEHTPSILNLFEASYPNPQGLVCFYVIHLLDLAGRSAPVLMSHQPGIKNPYHSNESEHIINALRFFEHVNRGIVTIYPFTAISPYASMHDDVCTLAAERRASLVILLFHKHPVIHVSEGKSNAIRAVNNNIIQYSPCSVGILIERGAINCNNSIFSSKDVYRVGVFFLGGPDDREALAYARRMSKHPKICLTLVRFVNHEELFCLRSMEQDLVMINKYKEIDMKTPLSLFREESVKDSMGILGVIRNLERNFDLILVGREHDPDSPLLAGLDDWNEYPELGCVGDMLVSLDSHSKASVLVVQQARTSEEKLHEYITLDSSSSSSSVSVVDMRWNDVRVWPTYQKTCGR